MSAPPIQRPVELHIEELVLEGFAPGGRYRIQDAVQSALVESISNAAIDFAREGRLLAFDTIAATPIALSCTPASPRFDGILSGAIAGALSSALTSALGASRNDTHAGGHAHADAHQQHVEK